MHASIIHAYDKIQVLCNPYLWSVLRLAHIQLCIVAEWNRLDWVSPRLALCYMYTPQGSRTVEHKSKQVWWSTVYTFQSLYLCCVTQTDIDTMKSRLLSVLTSKCPNYTASTLPRQWSLITISQDNHSFHPMFPIDHCRLVSIFRRKVRWRSEHVYTRITEHLSFDVAFICSTLTHCGVCHLSVWRLKWEVSYVHQSVWRWKWFFLPIKLCVTAASALQNVRYCFPTWNRFTAAVGLWNMLWW